MNKVCPRCKLEKSNVGPWKSGTWTELCGGCKIRVTLANPQARKRLADAFERDLGATSTTFYDEAGRKYGAES